MIKRLTAETEKKEASAKKVDEIQLAKDRGRIMAIEKIITKLYEDMIAGRINESNFNFKG